MYIEVHNTTANLSPWRDNGWAARPDNTVRKIMAGWVASGKGWMVNSSH